MYLDFIHTTVRLKLPNTQLLDQLKPMIDPLETATVPLNDEWPLYEISLLHGTPMTIPNEAEFVSDGKFRHVDHCIMAATETHLWQLFPDRASLKIERNKQRAEIVMRPGQECLAIENCLMLALEDMIDLSGQFILHAASLRTPKRDGNILIYAPSGVGKTTTTLGLLSHGFGLCSDDATILRNNSNGTTGWGLPRDMKVHENTVAMLPWLAPYFSNRWNSEGEQRFPRNTVEQKFPVFDKDPQPIVCVFSLARSPEGTCMATPLSLVEATIELTADNVRISQQGLLPAQSRRLDGLLHMISNVPVYKLEVGGWTRSCCNWACNTEYS